MQVYFDELVSRYNCRKTEGSVRISARLLESVVAKPLRTMRQIIDDTRCYRRCGSIHAASA
jgi:hypothetical protein